jgi:hypothetical protein
MLIYECLESVINCDRAYGMADFVVSAFLRVVTHPRIFHCPIWYARDPRNHLLKEYCP